MNSPIKVINHEGFIADLKAAHKGFGPLKLRPRNPNRKQFYPETEKDRTYRAGAGVYRKCKSAYQQDLPKQFATHFAFYGNPTVLQSVANIYKKGNINVFYTYQK